MSFKKKNEKVNFAASQSVRTTFRFCNEALQALKWLSERHGVTMKDVLHSSVDMLLCLETLFDEETESKAKEKELPRSPVPDHYLTSEKSTRRTLVVYKKTLSVLNELSKITGRSRDDLVNEAILFGKRSTYQEDQEKIELYKEALDSIIFISNCAEDNTYEWLEMLEEDDPIADKMRSIYTILNNFQAEIKEEIKKRETKLS